MDRTLIEKTYRFMQWLLERTAKFPKDLRYSLAVHVNDLAFRLFDGMLAATATRDRERLVRSLSVTLDTLRYYVRLSMDMKVISVKQYEYAAEAMNEMGRLIGGWLRSLRRGAPKEVEQALDTASSSRGSL